MFAKIFAVLAIAAVAAANPAPKAVTPIDVSHLVTLTTQPDPANDLCNVCVQFAGEAINELLNIILNVGVVGSCGELCGALQQKTGSKLLGTVCDLLCDIEGIKTFINLIEKADLDPIYFCEELKQCKVNDYGDAKITSFTVSPTSGAQGTTFDVTLEFVSNNGTGTGQIVFEVDTVDGIPLGSANLLPFGPAGNYKADLSIDASPDPDCDPTQQECEQWLPGNYSVKTAICNGECGSKHPHSAIYDEGEVTFTLN